MTTAIQTRVKMAHDVSTVMEDIGVIVPWDLLDSIVKVRMNHEIYISLYQCKLSLAEIVCFELINRH